MKFFLTTFAAVVGLAGTVAGKQLKVTDKTDSFEVCEASCKGGDCIGARMFKEGTRSSATCYSGNDYISWPKTYGFENHGKVPGCTGVAQSDKRYCVEICDDLVWIKQWYPMTESSYQSSWEYYECDGHKSSGGANGDPHFKTFGAGQTFDFHGGCDLVLIENKDFQGGLGMRVYLRTKVKTWWSYIESAVLEIGDQTLEVTGGPENKYWVNGVEGNVGLERGSKFEAVFADGHELKFKWINDHQRHFHIHLGGADSLSIDTFKDFVRVDISALGSKRWGNSVGMMGSFPSGPDFDHCVFDVLAMSDLNVAGAHRKLAEPEVNVGTAHRKLMETSRKLVSDADARDACKGAIEFDQCVTDVKALDNLELARIIFGVH
ncbi:expressed unknown protein [Seminavis robusta]|uniref:VWFD domain-containing protein n=1 Tax=Seminavis robusta TaxID=568900 RepID=A0A9N8EVY4_9STRA|nr:expressed unknown protein [Seminavis robusta]|eukprot:Sro2054_g312760.1 n/a (377) ;mRNA; r:13990-15801